MMVMLENLLKFFDCGDLDDFVGFEGGADGRCL